MERPEAVQPERDGEAAALVESIGKLSAGLDAERLEPAALDALKHDVARLTDIAATRREASAQLQSQLQAWRDSHAEALSGAAELECRLAALDARIGAGDMGRDRMETILGLFETALDNKSRAQETREACKRALDEGNYPSVSSLAAALQSLKAECDVAYAAIDKALAGLPEPLPTGKEQTKQDTAPDERAPEPATKHQADDEKEEPPDDEAGHDVPAATPAAPDDSEDIPAERIEAEVEHGHMEEGGTDKQAQEPEPTMEPQANDESEPAANKKEKPLDAEAGQDMQGAAPTDEAAPPDSEGISTERIEKEIAKALERGRFGIAYHLARTTPDALPGAKAIKLVACNYVTDERAPVDAVLPGLATELRDEAEAVLSNGTDQQIRRSYVALMAGAALAPARIAPGGPVAQLLSFLVHYLGDMPSLQALATTAADVSMKGIYLPVELLREDDSLERWTVREVFLRNETKNWIEKERQANLKFRPATKVWRQMLDVWENNGRASIGCMFELLEKSADSIDIDRVVAIADHWHDHREKEIDRIDRDIRSGSSHKIEGHARLNLRNKIEEAITFSDRWRKLFKSRPDKRPEFHTSQVNILRGAVRENAEDVLTEVNTPTTPLGRSAQKLVRRYIAMFEPVALDAHVPNVGLRDLLNGDLRANPNIRFDDTGRPSETLFNVDLLLHLASQDNPDFKHAAIELAKNGDFLNAEAAIDFAERNDFLNNDGADRARGMVEVERTRGQQKLKDKVSETSNRLDAAYARGVLDLKEFEQLRAKLPSDDFSEIDQFEPLFETLAQIDKHIDSAKQDRNKKIIRSLDNLENVSPEDRNRIETAINDGRLQVAQDFVERIVGGEELPKPEVDNNRPLDRFFPDFVTRYTAFRKKTPEALAQVQRSLENREWKWLIGASQLSVDAARDGIRILEAWASLCKGPTTADTLQTLMRTLGFANVDVGRNGTRTTFGEIVFTLRVTPIADRRIAQLPDFGSRANGRYRLLAIRGRTSEEAIFREVGEWIADGRPPNIVLFLNVLDVDSRRALAREFRAGRHRPTLVLDEAFIAFLSTWSGDRLGAFFDCASAFAFAQPFDPDAVEVPPEMFFGRVDARQAILNMSGDITHFVYGGRRLGKTAVLANIAREYRTGAPDQLAFLVSLKGSGIGENRPTDDLLRWVFDKRLPDRAIVAPQAVRPDSVERGIKRWLEEEPDRRILLLIDEADAFFEADQRLGYPVLEQIKRLMEETKRKFKVVFAGLHNVQRASRDPNTPFAHLGKPVRIGPMLPETDGDEIEKLIRGPLESLGYRFASTDSIIRIAAETNYYPALVQQFCKELLRNLRKDGRMHDSQGPPYTISQDIVNRVFDSKETRDRIRNLFSWTIQLDPRYEFLTYLIAQRSFDDDYTRPRPVPITYIRNEALGEWPKGFESDSSFWMFEVLLEEMVDLGILREVENKKEGNGYAIRTRNLRTLLGNNDEIERRFLDAKSRPAPPTFDPAQFRNTLNDKTPSSLTANQENCLLSRQKIVGLVFGTRLAGINRVSESLQEAARGKDIHLRLHNCDSTSMHSEFRQVLQSRKAGIDIVLIDMSGYWRPELVNNSLKFVAEQEAKKRIIRPVFLCGPSEAWEWLNGPRQARRHNAAELQDIWLGPCAKDFARTKLRDREAPAYACFENPDHLVDMPWPAVLKVAAGEKSPQSIADAIDITLASDDLVSDTVIPQTKAALRVWSDFPDDPMTADLLSELSGAKESKISLEDAIRFLDWAGRLGLAHKANQGYRLDSTYAKGIVQRFKE